MAKTFEPLVVESFEEVNKNFKDIQEKTKFGTFTPEFDNINSGPVGIGYFTLYGPMCHYLIEIRPTTGTLELSYDWTSFPANPPAITNLPYGPLSVPGSNGSRINPAVVAAPEYDQVLACWAASAPGVTGGNLETEGPWATITYNTSGKPLIKLPAQAIATGPVTLPAGWNIYISGSFIRR